MKILKKKPNTLIFNLVPNFSCIRYYVEQCNKAHIYLSNQILLHKYYCSYVTQNILLKRLY